MIQYKVGEIFPGKNLLPGQDYTRAEITPGFFDIICYIRDPTADEIRSWRKGRLRYGIFEYAFIPFFILDFPADNWNLDVSINILKIKTEEQQKEWLNADGNIVNLFLVDTRTNILEGARMISVTNSAAEAVRDVLEKQTDAYELAEEAELKIAGIQHTLTTADMILRTKMIQI